MVSMEEFASVVKKVAEENKGIEEIVSRTGLKKSSVTTKLTGLRKIVGKDSDGKNLVPSFRTGNGKARVNKDAIVALFTPVS